MFDFLKRVGHAGKRVFGTVGSTLRQWGQTAAPVVRNLAGFVASHHHHIAPLLHGAAVASGHEGLQKVTGLGLALSNAASMYQRQAAQNQQRSPDG